MGILNDWQMGGGQQMPGSNMANSGGTGSEDMNSYLMKILQSANMRRQSPLSQALMAPPSAVSAGTSMMPGLQPPPMRQPVGALPDVSGLQMPGITQPMEGQEKSALTSMPRDYSGLGMGSAAPSMNNMPIAQNEGNTFLNSMQPDMAQSIQSLMGGTEQPFDPSVLNQISGLGSDKLGGGFQAPSPMGPQTGGGLREQLFRMFIDGMGLNGPSY